MVKKKTINILLIITGILIFISLASLLVYFGIYKQTFVQEKMALYQWTRFYSCDREENFYCFGSQYETKPRPTAGTEARIGDYKTVTYVSSYESSKGCLDKPSADATPTYADSEGCQHWSYSYTTITEHCDFRWGVCANRYASTGCGVGGGAGCWNRYTTTSVTNVADYGGKSKILDEGWGCWQKFDIYYKDQLIQKTDWERQTGRVFTYEDITMTLGQKSKWDGGVMECIRIENSYSFNFPENVFEFNITATQRQVFEKQEVYANIRIYNNWKDVRGNLSVEFEVPTAIGSAKKTESKIVNISKGENVIVYKVPTEKITDEIIITPSLALLLPSSEIQGVNIPDEESIYRPPSYFQYYKYGTLYVDPFKINIIPRPLYLPKKSDGTCEYSDYVVSGDVCILGSYKNLTCFQIGCPLIEGHDYQCTSSGFCAETIFIQAKCKSDSDCEKIQGGTQCEVGSGLCVKTELMKSILQCEVTEDCAKPCNEKTISCIENKCVYGNQECISRFIDCRDVPCAEGSLCVKIGSQYTCERETLVYQDCRKETQKEGYICDTNTGGWILREEVVVDCMTKGCAEGFTCNPDRRVCEPMKIETTGEGEITQTATEQSPIEKSSSALIWIIAVLIVLIAIMTALLIKKLKKK